MSDLVWLIKIDVGFVTLGILKWELHYHILRQLKGGGGVESELFRNDRWTHVATFLRRRAAQQLGSCVG